MDDVPIELDEPHPKHSQFDLLTVFEWMLLAGLFFAALAGGNSDLVGTYVFAQLPADDSSLQAWLADELGPGKSKVIREGRQITITVDLYPWSSFDDLPDAPFEDLGYQRLKSASFTARTSILRQTVCLVVGVVLLLAIRLLRMRQARQTEQPA